MKKTKRILAMLLVVVMALSVMPLAAFAADSVSLTGDYYDVDDTGAVTGAGTTNPEQTVTDTGSDASVTYSKTAEATSNDNEFEITLNVETMQDLAEIETTEAASVVLVFNVDDSMDYTMDDLVPGIPGWSIDLARWTTAKKVAVEFIESFLADPNSGNQISIVVYGGSFFSAFGVKSTDHPVYATICDWISADDTDAIETVKATFVGYEAMSPIDIYYAGLSSISLREAVFNDSTGTMYGGSSNAQAGFKGATEQLGDSDLNVNNDQYVVFMASSAADDSDDLARGSTRDLTQTSQDAINEAGLLKSAFPDCTLYTVGFYDDTLSNVVLQKSADGGTDGNNPYVDEFFYATDAAGLAVAYETILSKVYTASQAWTVTDPMPEYVTVDSDFIDNLPDYCTWDSDSNTLVWDLTKCTPTTDTSGSTTVYTTPSPIPSR